MTYIDDIVTAIRRELPDDVLPDKPNVERLLRSYAVLVRAKGTSVTVKDVHDAWAAWMLDVDPGHPAIRPYEQLDAATQEEDLPFLMALQHVAAEHRRQPAIEP